ncbi:MAG: hypothetical protein HOC71_12885 [Candidatus Latescibacteria bacterium]|jgi:hypothetical protein|nr:hypothetical protein [Candidatus Latescibacterota bacterium]
MKSALFILTAFLLFSFGTAMSQVEKGDIRIGTNFKLTAFEDNTNADFLLDLGYSFTDPVEMGVILGVKKQEGHDTHGEIGGNFIFHLAPAKKVVPGLGVEVARTFGMHENETISDLFFNLDAFVSPSWSFNFKTGYERRSSEHHDANGFVMRFGIAAFLKPHHSAH